MNKINFFCSLSEEGKPVSAFSLNGDSVPSATISFIASLILDSDVEKCTFEVSLLNSPIIHRRKFPDSYVLRDVNRKGLSELQLTFDLKIDQTIVKFMDMPITLKIFDENENILESTMTVYFI
ncbi:Hypothetical protein NCDO2118_1694 [Lactococcus lactis subsp. lactis NCDO 2118]|uniref:Uncharacterized protein n=1 Tax=Lactococcus lactis subsp. lactis NCDO 2118 TaxID=1117941 RepID=A0ABC8A7H8_LACLL|nr:hypothetical protein [Lactococcus lactis]AII13153.1 Hypothetical protein NCDO2118_1694 [Lactococcus lactis subsp. lactis NCDO 2118]